MTPRLGDDGLWRQLVTVNGQPAVQVVDPPVDGSSATWAVTEHERAALADLMQAGSRR